MIPELKDYAGYPCLIFAASRALNGSEREELLTGLAGFLGGWESHGSPVTGVAALLEDRFVAVAHRPVEISGCGRDALLFFMQEAGNRLGVQWLGGARVFYRDENGNAADLDRPGFRKAGLEGRVTPDTIVFDTTVRESDALLNGRFALPARKTWHAALLPTTVPHAAP